MILRFRVYNLHCLGTDEKKIVIRNEHGEELVGVLHETGSTEIVILCHGFQSTKVLLIDFNRIFTCLVEFLVLLLLDILV